MQAKFIKSPCPECLKQNSPVTKDIDYVSCMPWLVQLGFDPIDVYELVAELMAAQRRTGDESCG